MLTREEVLRTCDELHACIEQGPGEQPGLLGRCLGMLRELREQAGGRYRLERVRDLELLITAWFSPAVRPGDEAARERLLAAVSGLEESWQDPGAA